MGARERAASLARRVTAGARDGGRSGARPGRSPRRRKTATERCGELLGAARAALGLSEAGVPVRHRPKRARTCRAAPANAAALIAAGAAAIVVAAIAGVLLLRGSDGLSGIAPLSVGVIDPASGELVADIPVGFESSLIAAGEDFDLDPRPEGEHPDEDRSEDDGGRRSPPAGIPGRRDPGRARRRRGIGLGRREPGTHACRSRDRPGARRAPEPITLEQTRLGSFSRPARRPSFSLIGDGAVWALERGRGEVTRIDPATGRRSGSRRDSGRRRRSPSGVAASGSAGSTA